MKRTPEQCNQCQERKAVPFFPSFETCKQCGKMRRDTTLSICWTCECGSENVRDCKTFIMQRCNATPEPWVIDTAYFWLDVPKRCIMSKTCGVTNEFDDGYWKERLNDVCRGEDK